MVQNCSKKVVKLFQNGSKMVPKNAKMVRKCFENGARWFEMVPNGSKWSKMDLKRFQKSTKMVLKCSIKFPKDAKMVP